ncbi:MAG: hypothetical protein AAGC44_07005 [Planctomycetota bacterium]
MFMIRSLTAIALFGMAALPVAATYSNKWHSPPSDQCLVIADAYESGDYNGSYKDPEFWGISFKKGCVGSYITSVTFDLRAGSDTNAYFDLVGSGSYGPVVGYKKGLSYSDITFVDTQDSPTLTIDFKHGSFGVGDKLYFGADVDKLGDGGAYDVGKKGVGFSVTFSNGETVHSRFYKQSYKYAKATAKTDNCCPTGIPTPAAAGMGMILLGGVATRRRRKA